MLSFRPHTPSDYDKLPFIDDESTGVLSRADRECLDALGDLLASKGATERFGVSLLHRHFATHEHELMVEEVDTARRLTTLSPKSVSVQSVYPVSIGFATADGEPHGYEIIGLEFVADLDDVAPIGAADSQLFDAAYALLARHGRLRRFGLRLVHDPLHLPDDLALLETCESAPRVLTCKVVPSTDEAFVTSIPTFFRWQLAVDAAGAGQETTLQACQRRCNVVRGCLSRGDGGHETHSSHDPNHERD